MMNAAGVPGGPGSAIDAFWPAMLLALAALCVLLGTVGLITVVVEVVTDRHRDGQLNDGAVPSTA